jgi:uncharacterized membrane protein
VLTEAEKEAITARVARVEAATGVQVVTAVAAKADKYPEIVWIAFALAASLAGLAVVVLDLVRPDWVGGYAALSNVLPVLLAGGASALAAILLPDYARLFLSDARRDSEVRQRARSMFVDHDLGRTRARRAVLLLVSRFERKVELVADRGFADRVQAADWRDVVDATTSGLARGEGAAALLEGLERLESMLVARGFTRTGGDDELPDAPLEPAT